MDLWFFAGQKKIMKRFLILTVLFLVSGLGAWFALKFRAPSSSAQSWDMEFGVPDVGRVQKIFIADRKGGTAKLTRTNSGWLYNDRVPVRPTAISMLLETIAGVRVQYIPTEAAKPGIIRSIAAEGIKVELYDSRDRLFKCYYVGDVTKDERGTYMIMDKSEHPYVVHVPAFIGQVRVRYMLGEDNWRDRAVFCEKPEQIEALSIEYPQQRPESFRLSKMNDGKFKVEPFHSTTRRELSALRKGVPEAYLIQFERLVAEGFENDNPVRDSVRMLVPFAIVEIKNLGGRVTTARFWPVEVEREPTTGKTFVVRYYTDLNFGESFLLTQHHVFGSIFRGYSFFFVGTEASGISGTGRRR